MVVFILYCLVFGIYFFPVLTHLNTRIYGIIGDNFWWFIWGWWSKNYQDIGIGSLYQNPLYGVGGFNHIFWNSTHPLGWGIASELIRFLPTNAAYNLLMIPTFLLAAFFAYLLFKHLTNSKVISFCFGLIFSFSPYHIFSSQRHTELAITWVIPLVVWTFLLAYEKRTLKYIFLASFSLALTMLSSVYWGVYLSIFLFCLSVALLAIRATDKPTYRVNLIPSILSYLRFIVVYFLLFLLMTIPFLMPYIRANYLESNQTTKGWVYQNTAVVKRGLSDFMLYSIMPYHFVIPPTENPITGQIGKDMVSFIGNNWHYFMAKNYIFSEHGGDFLGWLNIIVFGLALQKIFNSKLKIKNLEFVISGVLLYLFAMPPYFTIHGFKIYTPAYIVYTFFPMLRTLSRMGVIIFLCVLVVNAIFFKICLVKIETGRRKVDISIFYLLLSIFTLGTLAEFYMPLKYVEDSTPPPAYAYIGGKDDVVSVDYTNDKGRRYVYTGPSFIAEYPWGYDAAAFYQKYYRKGFANPLFYVNPSLNFNAMEFSYGLDSDGGLKKAYDLGVRYIVYHKGDEDTIARMWRGEDPLGFFKSRAKSYKDFGEIIVFEL